MANLMQRFLRNQSFLKAIPRLTPSLVTNKKPCISNVDSVSVEFDSVPLTNPVINVADKSLRALINDNSGLIETVSFTETVVEEKDEKETVIYADSVKKKRKKKMNKHKYRKLRERLGRKS